MKTFLATWIVIQLFVIGLAGRDAWNKVVAGTYECPMIEETGRMPLIGVAFPLIYFTSPMDFVEEYCNPEPLTPLL